MAFANILVTGVAGFIGFHLAKRLLDIKRHVIGIDNLNDYYDPKLKHDRLQLIKDHPNFKFYHMDIKNKTDLSNVFKEHNLECIVHLAAQAGVRYSLINPDAYIESNIIGFFNILEITRQFPIKHLVFASSSSVYGLNTKMPFSIHDNVDHPISLYAATKKANELMAHTYSYLYGIPCTGLRFFTVYGPWGRPDMALFKFTQAIIEGKPIDVYNNGNMKRDFTYIDDIIEGLVRIIDKVPEPDPQWNPQKPDPGSSIAPYKLYNIGNNNPCDLLKFIETIEKYIGKKAIKNFLPMQKGDLKETYADIDDLFKDVGFKPNTSLDDGIKEFIKWFKSYYKV